MRLEPWEIDAIARTAAEVFGPDAVVRLYGSRADEAKRGGDIDLYVECAADRALAGSDFMQRLWDRLGDQKIDVTVRDRTRVGDAWSRLAIESGVVLPPPAANPIPNPRAEFERSLYPQGPRPMTPEEALTQTLLACRTLRARLEKEAGQVAHLFPIPPDRLDSGSGSALSDLEDSLTTAFLKRFQDMVDVLSRRLMRSIAQMSGEDTAALLARDIANLMEKIGIITDRDQWLSIIALRTAIVHDYADDAAALVHRLNACFDLYPVVIAVLTRADAYIRDRQLLPGGADQPAKREPAERQPGERQLAERQP